MIPNGPSKGPRQCWTTQAHMVGLSIPSLVCLWKLHILQLIPIDLVTETDLVTGTDLVAGTDLVTKAGTDLVKEAGTDLVTSFRNRSSYEAGTDLAGTDLITTLEPDLVTNLEPDLSADNRPPMLEKDMYDSLTALQSNTV
nr:hypothetical protein [Tanacetum cinerariifolium]